MHHLDSHRGTVFCIYVYETGRWIGPKREDRVCGQCVEHFVLRCDGLAREREVLMKRMAEVTAGFKERDDEEKVTVVLDEGCRGLSEL